MHKVATKMAQRRFFALLAQAAQQPVMIVRHGRPRVVVVPIRHFRVYEQLYALYREEMALEKLEESLAAAAEGRLKTAAQRRDEAAKLIKLNG
jgi:prevent-host-death family protein